jgi:3-hydroxyisobutyrate dehydrogenase-like beta-hydroxyacid dehydrogenase
MDVFACRVQCDALQSEGAKVVTTPAAVVAASDITFGMLADPAAALAVAEGPSGIAAGMAAWPGKAYVDVSTVDAQTSQKISELVTSHGGRFLEVCSQKYSPSTSLW